MYFINIKSFFVHWYAIRNILDCSQGLEKSCNVTTAFAIKLKDFYVISLNAAPSCSQMTVTALWCLHLFLITIYKNIGLSGSMVIFGHCRFIDQFFLHSIWKFYLFMFSNCTVHLVQWGSRRLRWAGYVARITKKSFTKYNFCNFTAHNTI